MKAPNHALWTEILSWLLPALVVGIGCMLSTTGNWWPGSLFILIITIQIVFWHIPVHCQAPGCTGLMQKTGKPVWIFKEHMRYCCDTCGKIYERDVFSPLGEWEWPGE